MNNSMVLLGLVESVLNKGKHTSRGNYAFHCPFCHHHKPKLEINLEPNSKGENTWHCWTCDNKGKTVFSLFKRLDVSKDKLDQLKSHVKYIPAGREGDIKEEFKVELPKEFKSLVNPAGNSVTLRQALKYTRNRNISNNEIIKYNIGYCSSGKYNNSIIIPSYDKNGNINYFISRSFELDPARKYNAPRCNKNEIIGLEYFINWNIPIILCEGIFDAIAIRRNAIPLFGKTISQALMMKLVENNVKTIYIALDNDALKDALKHCEKLINLGKEVYLIQLDDKDPSDIGFQQFTKLLHTSTQLTFSDLFAKKVELTYG
jgi:DNA primase